MNIFIKRSEMIQTSHSYRTFLTFLHLTFSEDKLDAISCIGNEKLYEKWPQNI